MKTRAWTVVTFLFLSAPFLGCSGKSSSQGGGGGSVGITASKKAVVANGVNAITLSVTDTAGGPVSLTTTRGQFSGGGATATVSGAAGTVTLITCDASIDPACAGTATVTAVHGSAMASVSITFGALAAVCSADCGGDAACPTHACVATGGGTGTCSSSTPSTCVSASTCTKTQSTETTCNDGIDNDCNGNVDCADSACLNQRCSTTSATSLCNVAGQCVDTASGLGISVTPARTRLPADGAATTAVTVKVTNGTAAAGGMALTLSTDRGAFATSTGPASSTTGTTDSAGLATFTFTAANAPGVATLTAQLTSAPAVSTTAIITLPALGTLAFGAVQNAVQGVRSSGFQEMGYVSVLATDDVGLPYPDGLQVRFEHRQLGGSTLGAPLAPDTASCLAAQGCVGFLGATSSGAGAPDSLGQATAWLYSGTVAGTLVVTATATVGGVTRTITLPTVAVVGAKANGANFSVVCSPRNLPALAETDCGVSLVDAPFTCEALLKDRYNNLLGTQTQVVFMSEAASVGQVTSTPAYDPAKPAPDLGIATQIFNTLGSGLPSDVAPLAGEPSVDLGAPDACGVQVHNPRDGVVTIIAVADGEEAFFDANGNGVYDAGEPFVDQGEPFVDANDNGAWDPGEWFLDVNGDGVYTARNGVWDSMTKIWTQTVVVYTGTPATVQPAGTTNFLGTRWVALGDFTNACTPTRFPPPPNPPPAPQNISFAVTAAQAGPPPVAATSADFVVVASDLNLNQLASATTYDVAVKVGTLTATYRGFPSYADGVGMFYRYWPCDQTGACATQCRATGAALPCVMTPAIVSYGCGIAASTTITGGSAPDAGTDEVDWTVATPYSVYGTGKTVRETSPILGTSN